jgi:cytochrome c-type biogenesis protein CcmH/NrfG
VAKANSLTGCGFGRIIRHLLMSDPLRTDAARASSRAGEADREARIEQLLLAGLDKYFAGEYDQAINIWTRVVFLERGHSRARAYIERARGALAERHRESEELLHRGIAAFNDGQNDAARDLITRAVEQGGPHDVALVLLERLNRLGTPAASPEVAQPAQPERRIPQPGGESPKTTNRSWRVPAAAALAIATVAVAFVVGRLSMQGWLADSAALTQTRIAAPLPDPLPVPRPSERLLARARAFESGGHLLDAIRSLEAIDLADPLRPEADKLRGELQRRLLDTVAVEASR